MSFLALAEARYSTKKYNADKKVPIELIDQLKAILRLSPSSINSQPWKFVFIGNEQLKSKLAAASYFNEAKINEASHLVVFSAADDIEKFEEQIQQHLPKGSIDYYHNFVKPTGSSQIKSWMKNQVYLALGFFLSAAAEMGLDSTPMEGIQVDEYRKILGLSHHQPLFAVALGYRHPQDSNQPSLNAKTRLPEPAVIESF